MASPLPIQAARGRIVEALGRSKALVLTAPTGSGKSTQTPQFLLPLVQGRILVLEPRRLSARSLAQRVASEARATLGREVGYQVRFDSRCRADTKVVFQTYGVFVQQLLRGPELRGVGAVLLDEFHERTLECDLALAWLKRLRGRREDLALAVMSATLDGGALAEFLPDAERLDVPGRLFPVRVSHSPLEARMDPADGALRALQGLAADGLDGSVLVFMPGLREIRRTLTALGPFCRERGLELHALHGSMELSEQGRVLEPSEGAPRVIVATNVAETGLTIPGVTAVIDSGLHRVAAYDAARGINTLYLARISRGNAEQRAGRAGRTAPGRCVRLWSKADEAAMPDRLLPEILRLELSGLRLEASSLPEPVGWLTPPPEAAWSAAGRTLSALGAVGGEGRITSRGRALLRFPVPPKLAAVLQDARGLGLEAFERACAMAAVFETAGERRAGPAADLSELARELLVGGREDLPREAAELFKQLRRLGEEAEAAQGPGSLHEVWLRAFADRLAVREGEGSYYRMTDGRGAVLEASRAPSVMLALEVRERAGGGQARQVAATLFLRSSAEAVREAFPGECAWTDVEEFDARKQRVVHEERLMFRGLALERRERRPERADRKAAAEIWAEKYATGELRHPGYDDKAKQLVTRILVARALYPDFGFPEMGLDDWRLVYGEACSGKNSQKDIERAPLIPAIEAYLGRPLSEALDRFLPAVKKLPSGRTGRFTYFEGKPAELSARLGDFVGMKGRLALCEGRLPVLFDILAPNFRTVQKTADLGSFWANTYPTVKKELQRRYPKHPWP